MRSDDLDRTSAGWDQARNLLAAHLHQSLYEVHGGPWEAVLDFAKDSSEVQRSRCAAQLRTLLARFSADDDLGDASHRLGMDYHPTYDGYSSYRVWLTAVAEFLEDPVAHPGPPERDAPLPGREGAGGRVSTFTNRDVAERAVAENVRAHRREIDAWLADPTLGTNRAFEHQHPATIGRLAPVDATPETIHDVERSRIILRRSDDTAEGWFLLLAYPVATDPASPVARDIDRTSPEWDPLWTLLAGYLHQDFDTHGSVAGAVDAFTTDTAHLVAPAAAAVRRLLERGDESSLAAATEWLGMDYHPLRDGHTFRGWLTSLAQRLDVAR